MILEFSVSNFKSIGEKVTFSMVASSDDSNPESLRTLGKFSLSDKGILYGANGSGKSSLFQALEILRELILRSFSTEPGCGLNVPYNKILGYSCPFEISVHFEKDGIRFIYGCSIKEYLVSEEYLYYFPNNRQVKIFDRIESEITFGTKFKTSFNTIKKSLKPNKLFLSIVSNLLTIPEIESVFQFFSEDLIFYDVKNSDQSDSWVNYSIHKLHEDPALKCRMIKYVNDLGIPIKDLQVSLKQAPLPMESLPPIFSDEFKAELMKDPLDQITAQVVYDAYSLNLFNEESSGIKKLFEFLCPFFDIIDHDKILFVDEVESLLHESIVHYMLQSFSHLAKGTKAQLICITHDTNLLDLDIFRRDQVWFTETKDQTRETDLYSLSEISGVRRDENIAKNYLAGKYGAIPVLNHSFTTKLMSDMKNATSKL